MNAKNHGLACAVICGMAPMMGPAAQPPDQAAAHQTPASHVMTLDDAIRLATAHHPGLHAGAWRVEAAEGRAKQMRLWPNPELEFTAEEIPVERGGLQESINQVGISQTLPFPGKSMLAGKVGRLSVIETVAALDVLRLDVEKNVRTAFYRVLAAEGLVSIAGELVNVAGKEAEAAQERVKAGGIPAQEQLRAQIAMEQAKAQLAGFEADLEVARRSLAGTIGISDLGGATIAGSLKENADYSILAADAAPDAHPSISAAHAARDRSIAAFKRARVEPMPDITLGVAGGRDGAADASIMSFSVSLPLPLIDRSQGKTREARAEAAIAEAELQTAQLRLTRERAEAETRLRSADVQTATYKNKIIPMALEALKLVRTGFDEGKFQFIDLLDTQRTLSEARLAYQQKLLELNIAQAELDALLPSRKIQISKQKQ